MLFSLWNGLQSTCACICSVLCLSLVSGTVIFLLEFWFQPWHPVSRCWTRVCVNSRRRQTLDWWLDNRRIVGVCRPERTERASVKCCVENRCVEDRCVMRWGRMEGTILVCSGVCTLVEDLSSHTEVKILVSIIHSTHILYRCLMQSFGVFHQNMK